MIRRTALDTDPRTLDLYVQDQCSYLYDHAVRTADHFVDGARQKIHASAKFAFAPRAEPRGAAVVVFLDPPAPFKWAKKRPGEAEAATEKKKESAREAKEETRTVGSEDTCEEARSGTSSDSDSFVVVSPLAEAAEADASANGSGDANDAPRLESRGSERNEEEGEEEEAEGVDEAE